jgi:DNA-binding NtrC family response regulator
MSVAGPLVLIVDDEAAARRLLDIRVRGLGCQVVMAGNGREALATIERDMPALMLLDLQMPEMGGLELLRTLQCDGIDLPTIVITGHGSIEAAVDAIKGGASDFILKPIDGQHLEIAVRRSLERRQLLDANQFLRDALAERAPSILGESSPIRVAIETAQKAAATNATVLLLGESGTGKEVFAHAIHEWSARREKPFVVVNCVALSEHLLESELFGHERGAFTGAHQTKKGKFEVADGGTIFLDEIGDMPASLQAKLLRILQDHEFERVGGTKPIRTDIRVIAATNRSLDESVKAGGFRADLFYRLNVIRITLPPLRDRKEDLPILARSFIARYAAETKRAVRAIAPEAMDLLARHDWPGNVRELANTIERAVVLCRRETITAADLALPELAQRAPSTDSILGFVPGAGGYHAQVNACRRQILDAALRKADGNQSQAARSLGLQRTYFVKLLRDFRISDAAGEEETDGVDSDLRNDIEPLSLSGG